MCASIGTLAELEQVLGREKFDRYRDRESRMEFVATIRRRSLLFAVEPEDISAVEPPCRDSKDNEFLALARAAGVDVLVSSDEDLLVLNPWHGIPIVSPREFLAGFPDAGAVE
jgi:putative PIN family toxin of toxin-antitoxin system